MPDLQQELQSLANRRSAESSADFDAVLTSAGSRRRRRTAVGAAAAAAVLAAAAVVTVAPWTQGDSAPATTPRLPITVTPDTAQPGATVVLTFTGEANRGVGFKLARTTAPAKVLYYLTSDWGGRGQHTPTWWPAGAQGAWPDIGLSGPGSDRVIVPDAAQDGTYLVCTANALTELCGQLTVRR